MGRIGRRNAIISLGLAALAALAGGLTLSAFLGKRPTSIASPAVGRLELPTPRTQGQMTVEEAIAGRRSVREYIKAPLTLEEVSQLLWAAQGLTQKETGFRAAPSAGGTYPLELYVVVRQGGVESIEPGVYRYLFVTHRLSKIVDGDFSGDLTAAALDQPWVKAAQINLIITGLYSRTTARYGDRGVRYVHMEAGHVGENVYLQAMALGLGTVVIGAFYDDGVRRIVGASEDETPLYVMPVGKR